tara:strand:+ start:148 stop:342 length:195 start_codon:yes stop_codon:yes gene_type:complete
VQTLDLIFYKPHRSLASPFTTTKEERGNFPKWLAKKNSGAIKEYWALKSQVSICGLPTHILDKE